MNLHTVLGTKTAAAAVVDNVVLILGKLFYNFEIPNEL